MTAGTMFRVALLVAALAGALAAQRGPRTPGTLRFCPGSGIPCVEITEEAYQRGHEQFIESCGFCHGRNAAGGSTGPNLIRGSVIRHDVNGEEIGKIILEGRPGKGMPAVKLSDSQVASVVAYLHARVAETDKTSSRRPSRDYELAKLLTGNPDAGKAYFNGAGRCAGCHSPAGDLKGIAARYPPIELQARMLYPAGKRPSATVTDAAGRQFTGELLDGDAFDVAIKTADGWRRSWPAGTVKVEVRDPLAGHLELLSRVTTTGMHNLLAYLESLP